MNSLTFESELLELATLILRDAGYALEALDIPPPPAQGEVSGNFARIAESVQFGSGSRRLLLAQNRFFVLAVGSAATIEELRVVEAEASTELTRRLAVSQLGAKQWDAYLVLLTSQGAPDDGETTSELVAINYNTRYLRRIAQAGVRADLEGIRRALRPFLPLPRVGVHEVLEDALTQLEQELRAYGVDELVAGRAIAAFRENGSLSNV